MKKSGGLKKYDILGIGSSLLCLVHCLVPSFVVLGSNVAGHLAHHLIFDLLFFSVSFLAVITAGKSASRKIKVLMWLSLATLGLTLVLEHHIFMQILSYLAAVTLIIAHSINLRRFFVPGSN